MAKRIEYKKGDRVGNGFVFQREAPSAVNDGWVYAMGWFLCPKCGEVKLKKCAVVRASNIKSCGCARNSFKRPGNPTHGLYRHALYGTWGSMITRCYNAKASHYKYYGERGIGVLEGWRNEFKSFYDYVTSLEGYGEKGMTLDRIDNNGNYEPGNVRWATQRQQVLNSRAKPTKSGYIGVVSHKGGWVARITVKSKIHYLGLYPTTREAIIARDKFIKDNNLYEYKLQYLKKRQDAKT